MLYVYILETTLENKIWPSSLRGYVKKKKNQTGYAATDFISLLEDNFLRWTKSAQIADIIVLTRAHLYKND